MNRVQGCNWLLAVLVCLGLVLAGHSRAPAAQLFRPVSEGRGDPELVGVEGVERFRFVSVDLGQLGWGSGAGRFEPNERVVLNLFADVTVRAELERSGQGETGGRLWVGGVLAPAGGRAILVLDEHTLSGTVTVGRTIYQIRNDGDPIHVIRELSREKSAEIFPLLFPPGEGLSPERQLFQLVNHERRIRGLYVYEWSDTLAAAARAHSRDMARRSFFDHVSPDGRAPEDRIGAAGYDWRASGENIAAGQRAAVEVLEAWMNISGHRRNLLRDAEDGRGIYFCDAGVGYVEAPGSHYGHYWTQKFARSLTMSACCP